MNNVANPVDPDADDKRQNQLVRWLESLPPKILVDTQSLRIVAADASFRRYWRVTTGIGFPRPFTRETLIVLDAPPTKESLEPFLSLASLLQRLGLRAPRCVARHDDLGFALLEDFGDRSFTRALASGADEQTLYDLAIDTLATLNEQWRRRGEEELHDIAPEYRPPHYDCERLINEALLFVDWHIPHLTGTSCTDEERHRFAAAIHTLAATVDAHPLPKTLVLRDFHVDNLMDLSADVMQNAAARRAGLLDFQDALIGSPAYDWVSLADDARRDVPADLVVRIGQRFCAATGLDPATVQGHAALLGLQRALKIAGIFSRLDARDGKPAYLAHQARVWQRVHDGLRPDSASATARHFAQLPHWATAALEPLQWWFDGVLERHGLSLDKHPPAVLTARTRRSGSALQR